MHPAQAAPRQSQSINLGRLRLSRCTPCRQRRGKAFAPQGMYVTRRDAPRAGSAEAKFSSCATTRRNCRMHPVQAAPRQRAKISWTWSASLDAPRAGSAEAKAGITLHPDNVAKMHPVQAAPRQSARSWRSCRSWCGMHPVQAAPRQRSPPGRQCQVRRMHPVQAAPRQRAGSGRSAWGSPGCTPCRQRKAK